MITLIRQQWHERPLRTILIGAFLIRFVAVVFAKGYLMHDDHFLTVEPSSSWADGYNFNDWMPGIGNNEEAPEPISFFYLSILFLIFKGLNLIGLEDPEVQMFLMRLIHAAYSLLTIYFAYRITEKISNTKNAGRVGILLAFIAIMPNFGVRNLVEMVCQPPLMIGFYWLVKGVDWHSKETPVYPWKNVIIAALIMGLSVGIRYQTVLILAGVGLVMVLQKQWVKGAVYGLISFFVFFLTQIDDVLFWGGEPFQHLTGYFEYNKEHRGEYPNNPWTYLSFIAYFILPPVSLFLLFGFVRSWKKYLLLFLPIASFLLFHILFPNKQERFILPALPFVVMLGVIGWYEFKSSSAFWKERENWHRGLWAFFWILNLSAMLGMATTYSKSSRVEAMLALKDLGDCANFIQDASYTDKAALVPEYYLNRWPRYYIFRNNSPIEKDILNFETVAKHSKDDFHKMPVPNYVLFFNSDDLENRVARYKRFYPNMQEITVVEPGWFDRLLHTVNKNNTLETIYIYRLGDLQVP